MVRKYSKNPLSQWVKGIFIFQNGLVDESQRLKLMDTLDCEILSNHNDRIMVKTTLANLQSIKCCFLANDATSALSQELNSCVTQIIIGGKA